MPAKSGGNLRLLTPMGGRACRLPANLAGLYGALTVRAQNARMRIVPIGPSAPSAPVRRSERTASASAASFGQMLPPTDVAGAAGSGGTARLAQVDSLLALQEVPDPRQGRSKGLRRANDLLSRLEEIRLGLLTGEIPVHRLRSLSLALETERNSTPDPRLHEVMEEIELRCAVKLAKLGH